MAFALPLYTHRPNDFHFAIFGPNNLVQHGIYSARISSLAGKYVYHRFDRFDLLADSLNWSKRRYIIWHHVHQQSSEADLNCARRTLHLVVHMWIGDNTARCYLIYYLFEECLLAYFLSE
jgi:hypothetical protein